MRAPSDMPPRAPRSAGPGRGRTWLVLGGVALFFLVMSLRGIAGFYTDFLWFDSLGKAGVWRGVVGSKVVLSLLFTSVFFVVMWVNLVIADRVAPRFRPPGPEDEFIERYQEIIGGHNGGIRLGIAGFLALIAGTGVGSEWDAWLLFINGGKFGVADAQFGTDVGFYVFKLPFLSFVTGWLFATFLIVFIVTTVAHYLNGGIRMSAVHNRVTPQVKVHLSVLLALLALVKAGGYWLQRYDLTVSSRGFVGGAGYTDVNAQLPAINLLLLISIVSVLLFLVNIFRRGWTLPVVGIGLWALVAVVAGAIYPQFIQRFTVTPNEPERERPFIERNIEATREALGLDADVVQVDPYQLETDKNKIDLEANEASIRNVRIWDPSEIVLGRTFPQLQRVRDYYRVNDVDVDRYELAGVPTQVVLSARDLNSAGVPQSSWAARHLTYTHGYGAIVAPANAVGSGGEPNFVGKDIPYVSSYPELTLTRPELYFGENLDSYVVVGSRQRELSYEDDSETQFTSYEGADGVQIDNFAKRAAFAVRFGDVNPLISDQITKKSKILYIRDVKERAAALAPFLKFDADPYPVIDDGKMKWILDAYTTTDRYPYAEQADTSQLSAGSGLDTNFNYVRNSVKAVVDAYEGTVDFYVMPVDDPIIDAYRHAFPDLFTDFEEMPEGLRAHLRYPEDLFRVQTTMWASYHVTDADGFYQGNDYWDVARDPGTTGTVGGTQTTDSAGQVTTTRDARIEPYYLFTQLPGAEQPSFVLVRPFVPISRGDDNQLLTALMVGLSDGDSYGKLQVYVMPRGDLPKGPALVQGEIQSDSDVSQTQTLLDGGGSSVQFGSLTAIPIDGGLLYVRPFYVTSDQTEVPALRKVIVYFGGEVVIRDSLDEGLAAIFGEAGSTPVDPGGVPDAPPGVGTLTERVAALLVEADALFTKADEALRNDGDLGGYADLNAEARQKIAQAEKLLKEELGQPTDPGATTTTTEPSAST